jgi:hypothetical protein
MERRTEDAATFFSPFNAPFPQTRLYAHLLNGLNPHIEGRRRSNISRAITWAQSTEFERRISYGWPSFLVVVVIIRPFSLWISGLAGGCTAAQGQSYKQQQQPYDVIYVGSLTT